MTKSAPLPRWKSIVDATMSASSRTSSVRTSTGLERSRSRGEACVERPYRLDDVADVVVRVDRREREGENFLAGALCDRQRHGRRVALAEPTKSMHGQEVDAGRDEVV